MAVKLLLFGSSDRAVNREADALLSKLRKIEVEFVPVGRLLENKVLMPFVETASGERYYGLDSISAFVEQELQRNGVKTV